MKKSGKAFEKVKLRDYAKLKADIGKDGLDLAVKKLSNIKNVEIEYFNQSKKHGVAIALFERLLDQVKAETCEKLADDLISVLRFWIDAVRKNFTRGINHWWDFLKRILNFIQVINCKDSTPDKLLQLSPSLLDLTCGDSLSPQQCLYVLHCINMYSSVSSRLARLDNKANIAGYFPKLAREILASGHYYYQFSALECIVRWIVPRDPETLRAAAAYFPRLTNTQHTIFVEAKWGNFVENARDFLNAINEVSGLVKSVKCKKISVGVIDVYDSTNKQHWLDISTCEGSVSAQLEPRVLQRLVGLQTHECEALVFTPTAVTLRSGAEEVIISLKTAQPPRILPCDSTVGTGCDVTVLVSSQENLQTLHEVLQNIFHDKYQRLIADDVILAPLHSPAPSPCSFRRSSYSSDSARFSSHFLREAHAIEPVKNSNSTIIHCGDVILQKSRSRQSSVSSTSLAHLSIKLARLPKPVFKKEFIRLEDRVKNTLSHISERTEDSIHPLQDHRRAFSDTEGETSVLASRKATNTTDNIVDTMEEAEKVTKSCTVVSKTTTDDDQYSTDVISDTPGLATSRQSMSKNSIQGARKRSNKDTKHIVDQQVCNKEMANKHVCPNFFEYVVQEEAKQKEKETTFDVKTINRQAKPKTVRPQITKTRTYKASETCADKFTSIMKQPSKENNIHVCTIPGSEQEDIVEASSQENLNQSEVEKLYKRDDTPAVDQNAKRKRKLYSPKDDRHSFKEPSSKTNKDTNIQRDASCNIILAQRQKAGNTNSNDDLQSPRTVQRNITFDNRQAKPKTVRPQRSKKRTYKASEACADKFTSIMKQPSKEKNVHVCTIPESEQEDIVEATSQENLNQSEVEKPYKRDDTPAVDQNAKRKRKLYSPKDDDHSFKEPSFKTNKDTNIQGDTSCNIILAQRQKAGNTNSNYELQSPRTVQRNITFDNLINKREETLKEVMDKNTKGDVYNYTSEDSYDEDFEERRQRMTRQNTSSETKQTKTARKKNVKQPTAPCRTKKTIKKQVKRRAPRQNSLSIDITEPAALEDFDDERMRATNNDNALDNSFVITRPNEEQAPLTLPLTQLILQISGDDNIKAQKTTNQQDKPITTGRRTTRSMSVRQSSPVLLDESGSPLPGLIIEEDITSKRNDITPAELEGFSDICYENQYFEDLIVHMHESDISTGGKDPAGNVEKTSDKSIVNQSNGGSNISKEVPKKVGRRNSATQTSPEKSVRLSAVENTTNNRTASNKTPAKDKNTELGASTLKRIEQNTDEGTEIRFASRKRKASPEGQSRIVPRMLYGKLQKNQDDRVSCVRCSVQSDEGNVTATEGHNDNPRHQLQTTSTDARLGQVGIILRRLQHRVNWLNSCFEMAMEQINESFAEIEAITQSKDS